MTVKGERMDFERKIMALEGRIEDAEESYRYALDCFHAEEERRRAIEGKLARVRVVLPDIKETCEMLERRGERGWAGLLRGVLNHLNAIRDGEDE